MKLSARTVAAFLVASPGGGGAAAALAFSPALRSSTTVGTTATRLYNGAANEGGDAKEWSPDSWKGRASHYTPPYEDTDELAATLSLLETRAPLVFAGECRRLRQRLADASRGKSFVLMGGDRSETFKDFRVDKLRDTFKVMMQMALVMSFGGSVPVTKVGRVAGQFAKVPPSPTETREEDGVSSTTTLPSHYGDIVNSAQFAPSKRRPDPCRMLRAYHQSAQSLNILRAFSDGGLADLSTLHSWNLDFANETEEGSRYRSLVGRVDESMRFMEAAGIDTSAPRFASTEFYTAHKCLLLPYETALTRVDSLTGDWYDCSAHMLWAGRETVRDGAEGAHVEFLRGVKNPLGVTVTEDVSAEEVMRVVDALDPENEPGRMSLVISMGAEGVRSRLPELIRMVEKEGGREVTWMADPIRGENRDFEEVRAELRAFFDVHDQMGTHPGGVRLEMTGEENVAECRGGVVGGAEVDAKQKGGERTRLNGKQALELAFLIADRMSKRTGPVAERNTEWLKARSNEEKAFELFSEIKSDLFEKEAKKKSEEVRPWA